MNNFSDLQKSVLTWLDKRSCYIESAKDLAWVERDPVVSHLFPLLYVINKENGGTFLSESVRKSARAAYLETHAKWLVREKRLKQILNLLYSENIDVIPLKGVILQSQLYRNSGIRRMGDIDLLVRPSQYLKAAELLLESGFILYPNNGFDSLVILQGKPISAISTEIIFVDKKNSWLIMEIHRHPFSTPWFIVGFNVNLDEIWGRTLPATEDIDPHGLWKIILSPYDTLALLVLHLALHGLQAMQTYLDIDLWIRNLPDTWEWERFLELVNQWQIRSVTYHALSICRDFMETPLPDKLLERLDPGWLARLRVRMLISSESILANRPSLGRRYTTLVKLALIDRLPLILLTLIKLAFPNKAWREHNPYKRSPLAHWLHVLHVVKRGD